MKRTAVFTVCIPITLGIKYDLSPKDHLGVTDKIQLGTTLTASLYYGADVDNVSLSRLGIELFKINIAKIEVLIVINIILFIRMISHRCARTYLQHMVCNNFYGFLRFFSKTCK